MSAVRTCPGLYCGRIDLGDGVWSECGACPRGFRTNDTSYCTPCTDEPSLYDWQYLGFMVLLPMVLHWFSIDMVSSPNGKENVVLQHLCATLEVVTGTVMAILALPPAGTLRLHICAPQALSDWYTLLHNPQPDYKETLHCTQEAVYPLYTLVVVEYVFSLVLTLTLRPWLARGAAGRKAIYCALYFYPILVLIHTLAAGLIYCSFPYIIIIISMISSATHFGVQAEQSCCALARASVTRARAGAVLAGHWAAHAYGLVSLTGGRHAWWAALVPAPAAFYILTAPFTDPAKIHGD